MKCAADNDTRGTGGTGYIITGYEGKNMQLITAALLSIVPGGSGGAQFEQDIITYATINKNSL